MTRRWKLTVATIVAAALGLAGAASLYERSKDNLVHAAEQELGEAAQTASADASRIFEPGPLIVDRVLSARLPELDPALLASKFFALGDFPASSFRQVDGIYIGTAGGSFYHITNLIPAELAQGGELAPGYHGLIRRTVLRDGAPVQDRWYYQDGQNKAWMPSAVPPFPPGFDPRTRPWYQAAIERNGLVWSKPYYYASTSALGITLSAPIKDQNGKLWGVVGVDFSLASLASVVGDYEARHVGSGGFMFIADDAGSVLARERLASLRDQAPADLDKPIAQMTSIRDVHRADGSDLAAFDALASSAGVAQRTLNGRQEILAIRLPLDPKLLLPDYVYLGRPLDTVIGAAIADLRRNIAILAVLLAIMLIVALYAARLRHEIGARRRTEAALRESEAYTKVLFQESYVPIAVSDPERGVFIDANPAAVKIYGFASREELIGKTPLDVSAPAQRDGTESQARLPEASEKALRQGLAVYEWRHRRPDGTIWDAMVHLMAVTHEGKRLLQTSLEDITEQRRMEGELRRSHEILEHAQELGHIGSVELDLVTGQAVWSDELLRIYGFDPTQTPPDMERIYGMIHPDDVEALKGALSRSARGEATETLEFRITRTDGEDRWIHREVELIRDAAGKPIRYFATQQDVTDRKKAEQALERAKEMAEEATRMKSSFLAMMSHEIRTPMNGVMAMAEMLDQTELTHDQHEMSSVIRSSASALLAIINDILDFSKIEAGKLDVETVPFSLVEVVEGAGELVCARAEERGIDLIIDAAPALPDALAGDPTRLRQILLNLMGNAVKFTETGHVMLRVVEREHATDQLRLRFEVTDTGIGLTEEQRQRLFQPFVQADSSTSRKYGGTGLGLSICHRLCVLMGGAIGVDSVPGQGSTFWFELPFAIVDAAPKKPAIAISDARITAIGFAEPERAALNGILRAAEIDAIDWQPAEAVKATMPEGQIVLLRASPSDMAGLEGARRTGGRNRIIACAPRGLAAALGSEPTSGIFAALTRPLRRERLWQTVAAALGRADLAQRHATVSEAIGWAPPSVDEARAAGALILVAEDNTTNQLVVRRMLDQRGYAHEMAENGVAALALYGQGGHGLLLTDFHMPEMDGFQLTAAIRGREAGSDRRLPIVALTADALPGTERIGIEAGMDAYLAKPISGAALTAALEKYLPQALELRRRPSPGADARKTEAPRPAINPEILDLERVREVFGSLSTEALSLLEMFTEEVTDGIRDIETALRAGQQKNARGAAHKLKGAAKSTGAERLGQLASDIQDRLDEDDLATSALLCEALPPAAAELRAAIDILRSPAFAADGAGR